MKRVLLTISYYDFVLPTDTDLNQALLTLGGMIAVSRNSVEGKTIYTPDKDVDVKLELINEGQVRLMTEEEKDNKKISSLESSLRYSKKEVENKTKRIEELECIVKQLKGEAA